MDESRGCKRQSRTVEFHPAGTVSEIPEECDANGCLEQRIAPGPELTLTEGESYEAQRKDKSSQPCRSIPISPEIDANSQRDGPGLTTGQSSAATLVLAEVVGGDSRM